MRVKAISQRAPAAADTGLGRPHRAALHYREFGIAEAIHSDREYRLTLIQTQQRQRAQRLAKLYRPDLSGLTGREIFKILVLPCHLPAPMPIIGVNAVAQDDRQPSLQIRSNAKRTARFPSLRKRALGHIVSEINVKQINPYAD
jgi:hypothetical protein